MLLDILIFLQNRQREDIFYWFTLKLKKFFEILFIYNMSASKWRRIYLSRL